MEFSETSWEQTLATYNVSLTDDDLNRTAFAGERGLWSDLASEFPQYQRKACFLMIFSMLEDDLNQFCEALRIKLDLRIAVSEIAGRGIERAKIYLSKIAEIEFPSESAEWERILRFRDLRNVLVHEAGYLDEEKNQHRRVKEFSERRNSGLSIEHYARDRINFAPEFVPGVLSTLRKFYEHLIAAIRNIEH